MKNAAVVLAYAGCSTCKKALAWLDKAGKVLSVISIGAVGRKEVVVGTDLTSLSAGLTGNISPHPGGLVQGTGSLV